MPLDDVGDSADLWLTWHVSAPTPAVWRCLTQPELLGRWLGDLVSGDVRAGSTFVVDHGDGYLCRSTVSTCVEDERLAVSWEFPDEPRSTVDVELEDVEGTCVVRLTHRGLGDLVPAYRDGWCVHLLYLEAAALGTPLPPSMFWPLHRTLARSRGTHPGR